MISFLPPSCSPSATKTGRQVAPALYASTTPSNIKIQ